MDSVFTVETKGKRDIWLEADLPLTPYEMLDLLEKEGLTEKEAPMADIDGGKISIYVYAMLSKERHNLYELNALAEKLSQLDNSQRTAFTGLVRMENGGPSSPVSLGRLIDLAYSTDCTHVLTDVHTDAQLGRFYAENGFVPEADDLSDETFEKLDFAAIGKDMRLTEGGVFVKPNGTSPGGYVVRTGDQIKDVYSTMDFTPKKPDYAILLRLSKGSSSRKIKLPGGFSRSASALASIGAKGWDDAAIECLDCRVPSLMAAINGEDNMSHTLQLADQLDEMEPETLLKFKAVLEAAGDCSVEDALDTASHLDEYQLDTYLANAEDVALDILKGSMGLGRETLLPYVNLSGYGQALIKER